MPSRSWFDRDPLDLAPDLLGAFVTSRTDEGAVTLRITEVEAYRGTQDPASHAFRGRTARNGAMFGEAGRLYVYRHLGLHTCVNIVCGSPDARGRRIDAAAVLLRAGEVVEGLPLARERRTRSGAVRSGVDVARGPARLAVALGVGLSADGADVTDPRGAVVVHRASEVTHGLAAGARTVVTGPRVGVGGEGGDGTIYPWRFWLAGEPSVSAYRAAYRRPTRP